MASAHYLGRFSEYEIQKIDGYEFVLVKDSEGCDIVYPDVDELVFADGARKFSELFVSQAGVLRVTPSLNKKGVISVIRIVIRGYDESLDRLGFDTAFLNLKQPYKYSISGNSIEIRFDVDNQADEVLEFLSSVKYEYSIDQERKNRTIFVYADDELAFNRQFES